MHFAGENRALWIDEHAGFTGPGDPDVIYQLEVLDGSEPLRVTLVWSDYPSTPAASVHLLNDLDLRVDGASGGFLGNNFHQNQSWPHGSVDRLNNVEQIHITDPEPGVHTLRVSAHAVPHGPQPFAVVVSGGEFNLTTGPAPSYRSHAIDDSGPNGNGDGVLDPGETARIPVTLWNAGDAAATSVIGRLYSSAPGLLTVYDGEASYPDMAIGAEGGSQAPHYQVTLQPGASCGQIVGTTLSVSGAGFEVGTAFTIPVGRYESSFTSTDTPIAIPREGTINSYINVPDSFPFEEIDAEVHVLHDDISELELLHYSPVFVPGESPVYLHNESRPGEANIDTIYDDLREPDGPGVMDDFIGRESQGNWRLKINDVIRGTGGGELTSWTLHLKSKQPFDCNPMTCGDPVPPAVGHSVMVSESGANDLLIDWDAVGGASEYNVWRSLDPRMRKASHAGRTGSTSLTDSGAQSTGETYFYEVRSVNSCNWESP
jgi:subtilisin-like proprotein convertase family protein